MVPVDCRIQCKVGHSDDWVKTRFPGQNLAMSGASVTLTGRFVAVGDSEASQTLGCCQPSSFLIWRAWIYNSEANFIETGRQSKFTPEPY